MEKYFKVAEAAKILNINPTTLRRWDKSGKLKGIRHPINNYRVYAESKVHALVCEFNETYAKSDSNISNNITLLNANPYYYTDHGKLFNIDAIELMRNLPSKSVDLIFADPPYNIKKAEWDTFSSQKAYVEWSMEWIKEAHRILTPNGSLYICGFSEILADLKWSTSNLFKGCKWLIWFYRNKGNLGNDWGRSHESILHLRKSEKYIFNIDEVRIPYNEHTTKYPKRMQGESSHFANKKGKYEWEPHPLGAKPKDVLEIPTISNGSWEKTVHITQKPIELLRKIILCSSNENSIILDPFGGSGTTYAVAEAYGRKWIGSELDKNYCSIIKNRLKDKSNLIRIIEAKDEKNSQTRRQKLRG